MNPAGGHLIGLSHDGGMGPLATGCAVAAFSVAVIARLAVPALADTSVAPTPGISQVPGATSSASTMPQASPISPSPAATPSATTLGPSQPPPSLRPIPEPLPPAVRIAGSAALNSRVAVRLSHRLTNIKLGTDVAVVVRDAATGALIFSRQPTAPMHSASNMKLITAVDALTTMPASSAFHTSVFAGASPSDIVLKGQGDPMLTVTDVRQLADDTAATFASASSVTVHLDMTYFAPASLAPGWPASYVPSEAAAVSPLAYLGDYSASPQVKVLKSFVTELNAKGLHASVGPDAIVPAGTAMLADSAHHTLSQAIHLMLQVSENNIAETLFRHVAISRGLPPTWSGSQVAALQTLQSLGVSTAGLTLADGSGLSRADTVTAQSLVQVLALTRGAARAPYSDVYATDALPIAGKTGTLRAALGRFTSAVSRCVAGSARGKTGTLHDTVTMSGVTDSTDGSERIFSILVNQRPEQYPILATRQAVDALVATINGCYQ